MWYAFIIIIAVVFTVFLQRRKDNKIMKPYEDMMAKKMKENPYRCHDCGRGKAYVGAPCVNEFCPSYYLNLEMEMGTPAYTVNDKRGKEEVKPCCRVCGCSVEHSTVYNQPTMLCIEYLRKQISDLKKEKCYGCEHLTTVDGTIPWCKKMNRETNALAPTCQGKS